MANAGTTLAVKLCRKCGESKPASEFYAHRQKPHLLDSYCKRCANESSKQAWRSMSPERQYAAQFRRRLKKYGLTPESYDSMLLAQGRRCLICGAADPGGRPNHEGVTRFCVDHSHATGKVRGLLCVSCNVGIAQFKDDIAVMARAIAYIEESK